MPRSKSSPPVRAQPTPKDPNKTATDGLEVRGHEIHWRRETRHYRIRGFENNQQLHRLLVNLLVHRDELIHTDTLDLYKARARTSFIQAAATELYVEPATIKQDVGQLLLQLELLQQQQLEALDRVHEPVEMTSREQREALAYLNDPNLTDRILADYDSCGLVGETTNKLICYLACVSRRLPQPLAILIQSSSAAGKTSLMDATLALMPEEHTLRFSGMTGQALYYMGQHDLKHKILAIAEEAGVQQASYALKLLQSDGRLRMAATGKSTGNGRQQTGTYEVEGPVMMFLTTTAETPDAELQNRCLTLHVNESAEQTEAIQARQRAAYTLSGEQAAAHRQKILSLHRNAQRSLETLPVIIPFAEQLKFRHHQPHMRREHAKYLALIAASALLHQYQRPRITDNEGTACVEASWDDVRLANQLLTDLEPGRAAGLLPKTRQLINELRDYVEQRSHATGVPPSLIRFTQRELRESLGWGDFALRRQLARLVQLEYVIAYHTGRGNQRAYELCHDGALEASNTSRPDLIETPAGPSAHPLDE